MVQLTKVRNPDMRKQLEEAFTKYMGNAPVVGNVTYVSSVTGSATSDGSNIESPISSIDAAVGVATANNGDVIFVLPGHTETLATATALVLDKAGVTVIGLGSGNDRPKITLGTLATTTISITAASVTLKNIIVIGALDGLNSAITITGDYPDIDVEYRDTSAAVESNIGVTATSVDHGKIKLKYAGFIAGNAVTNAVVLDGCTSIHVDVDFYGNSSAAVVEFTGHACHNIFVSGYFYNESSAALSLDCDDTITGSTWFCVGYDGKAGYSFAGGSGSALAGIDTSAIAAALATIDAFHDVPVADVADNAVISDVVGNKDDTVAGTSLVALNKQLIATIGSAVGADISADIAAIKAVCDTISAASVTEIADILAAVDTEIAQIIAAVAVIDGLLDIPSIDLATNATFNQVIGNKSDTVSGTSLVSLAKQIIVDLTSAVTEPPTAKSLHDILHKDGSYTFDNTTDSLEAIADAVVVIDAFHDVPAQNSADNVVISDVVGNKTDTTAGNSLIALSKQIIEDTDTTVPAYIIGSNASFNGFLGTKVTKTAADILDSVQNAMFTVAGGRVLVTHLELEVTVAAIDAGANNTQILTNPTVGTDAPMCAVKDVDADELGTVYTITGKPGDAMAGGSGGGAPGMDVKGFVVPEGTIDLKSAADGGVGGALIKAELWYIPLDSGATVTAT